MAAAVPTKWTEWQARCRCSVMLLWNRWLHRLPQFKCTTRLLFPIRQGSVYLVSWVVVESDD